jgi:plastocyanin
VSYLSDSRRIALLLLLAAVAACNKASETSPTPIVTNTITITSNGASPQNIQVAVGSRVLVINNDTRPHNFTSDPHPDHTDCAELNQVGFLAAGQSRETGNLVAPRTCGFHDHDDSTNARLKGSIKIQ